jgi:hypothetical protein
VIALGGAYLANAALCLVIYASASGALSSRSGWVVTAVIVWPIAFDLIRQSGAQEEAASNSRQRGIGDQLVVR